MHPFKKLTQCKAGAAISSDRMAEYVKFYGLERPDTTHQAYPIECQSERIMVQLFTPAEAKGVAVMCHGYYDHVGIYGHLLRFLLASGRQVITFDQPGHGLSTGKPAQIQSFDSYVQTLSAVLAFCRDELALQEPQDWVAQSMGGAVLMEYFAQTNREPRGEVVLFAPLVRPFAWWINRWVFAVAKRTIHAKRRVLTRNSNDPDFLAKLAQDPLQADTLPVNWVQAMVDWSAKFVNYPTSNLKPKIIQGQLDHTIDWQFGQRVLKERYPDSQWLMLPKARHHLVNESAELRKVMFGWISEWIN